MQQGINWRPVIAIAAAVVMLIALLFALIAVWKAFSRYQKRADANNRVKVTAIQIRNQEQRVKVAQQQAQIRLEQARGIRKAQDEISSTLTPLYVQFEAYKALERIAESGKNNAIYFVPLNNNGLPVVPTLETTKKAASE